MKPPKSTCNKSLHDSKLLTHSAVLAQVYLNLNTGCYFLEVQGKAECYSLVIPQ